jgi:hypothetical protein
MPQTIVIIILAIIDVCTAGFAVLLCRYIYSDLKRQSKAIEDKNAEMLRMYESIEGFMDTFYTESNALKAEVAEAKANVDDVRVRTASQVKEVFYTETNALKAELEFLRNSMEELRPRTASQVKDMLYSEMNALRSDLADVRADVQDVRTRAASQVKDVFYAETDALKAELSLLRDDVEGLKTRTEAVPQEKKERAKRGRSRAVPAENEREPRARELPPESARDGGATEADEPAFSAPSDAAAEKAAASSEAGGAARGESKPESVMRLYREGKSRQSIAKEMNMTKNEVDLIINLREIMPGKS